MVTATGQGDNPIYIVGDDCLIEELWHDTCLGPVDMRLGGTLEPFVMYSSNMCQGLNSHYFPIYIIGDGHQPNSRGLYTHYKDSY